MAAGLAAGAACAGEPAYVFKLVNITREAEWQTMSEVEYKALEKNLKLEEKLFSKAVELAVKEWKADELNKKFPFPSSKLTARTIKSPTEYSSREKAEEQLAKVQDAEARKMEKQAEKEKYRNQRGKDKVGKVDVQSAADLVLGKLNELLVKAGGEAIQNAPVELKAGDKAGAKVEKGPKEGKKAAAKAPRAPN